jgi:regulator of replication initiation timing
MTDTTPKKNILDRISDVEVLVNHLLKENKALKGNLAAMVDLCSAIIKVSGTEFADKVKAVIAEAQRELQAKEQAHQKGLMDALVQQGALARTDSVTTDSIIAFKKTEGNLVDERVQAHFEEFPAEARLKLVDQPVGAVIELPGMTLEVLEIFRAAPNPTESVK